MAAFRLNQRKKQWPIVWPPTGGPRRDSFATVAPGSRPIRPTTSFRFFPDRNSAKRNGKSSSVSSRAARVEFIRLDSHRLERACLTMEPHLLTITARLVAVDSPANRLGKDHTIHSRCGNNRARANAFRKFIIGQTKAKRSGPSKDSFLSKRGQLLTGCRTARGQERARRGRLRQRRACS